MASFIGTRCIHKHKITKVDSIKGLPKDTETLAVRASGSGGIGGDDERRFQSFHSTTSSDEKLHVCQ